VPKPIYLLSVEEPGDRDAVLIVRTGVDGIVRATITLPGWHELPRPGTALMRCPWPCRWADSYAHEYGYRAIGIDIESSQLCQPEWGDLQLATSHQQ